MKVFCVTYVLNGFFFQEKGNRNWAIGVGEIFLSAKAKVSFYI
jgi:hypothetical protein